MPHTTKLKAARAKLPAGYKIVKDGTKRKKKGKINGKLKRAGKEVVRYARRYKKKHPGADWNTAMKHGGVEYRKRH